jgi:hypothetical protein
VGVHSIVSGVRPVVVGLLASCVGVSVLGVHLVGFVLHLLSCISQIVSEFVLNSLLS